jgi:hypothetical protein
MPLIRASELAQYSFCHRAWWLATVQGQPTRQQTALKRGVQLHLAHQDKVKKALRWRYASFFLFISGFLLLIVGVVRQFF